MLQEEDFEFRETTSLFSDPFSAPEIEAPWVINRGLIGSLRTAERMKSRP